MSFRVFTRCGDQNIRLGNFCSADGQPWCELDEVPPGALSADVLSGSDWVDFPGTYTAIRLVASDSAFQIISDHRVDDSIKWAETIIEERRFWTMQTADARCFSILEDCESTFNPIYKARPDAVLPNADFVLDDDSYEILFSDRLASKIIASGLVGAAFASIEGL